jgi:hypothetical protein
LIYAAFTLWLLLVMFAGVGVYRLWTTIVRPAWVHWALLPGTVVSEMAYIFGCLITGGEVRRARLIELPGRRGKRDSAEPTTDAAPGLKVIGPILASLLAVIACVAGILLARRLLGPSVIEAFTIRRGLIAGGLPKALPGSWDEFWRQSHDQLLMLRQMCETLGSKAWLDWRGVLFVYLAACLSVRLSPVTRPMRPTLAAVVVIAVLIAVVGLIWKRFDNLVNDIWPLLTYIWASLLFLLVVTLLIRGIAGLAGILTGRAR